MQCGWYERGMLKHTLQMLQIKTESPSLTDYDHLETKYYFKKGQELQNFDSSNILSWFSIQSLRLLPESPQVFEAARQIGADREHLFPIILDKAHNWRRQARAIISFCIIRK